jgi:hypothetical protein
MKSSGKKIKNCSQEAKGALSSKPPIALRQPSNTVTPSAPALQIFNHLLKFQNTGSAILLPAVIHRRHEGPFIQVRIEASLSWRS